MNQINLKFWADVADKIFFGCIYKFGIGIWFSAVQWRQFPHRASVVHHPHQIKITSAFHNRVRTLFEVEFKLFGHFSCCDNATLKVGMLLAMSEVLNNNHELGFTKVCCVIILFNWKVRLKYLNPFQELKLSLSYRKVTSFKTSSLEVHAGFFRLLLKGIFSPYLLWPFDKKLTF